MKVFLAISTLLTFLLLVSWPECELSAAPVTTTGGVAFSNNVTMKDVELRIVGTGVARYGIVISIYAGAFYLPPDVKPGSWTNDVAKHLVLEYFHNIGRTDIAEATENGVSANVDGNELKRIRPELDRLKAMYKDVKLHDRYALTYIPGAGMDLTLNGQLQGSFSDPGFIRAVYAVWVGDRALDSRLRKALLRKAAP